MECTARIITLRVEAGIISKILDRNQVFVPVLAILRLAGFITLRVEAGIISKILDHNQVFVPLYHGSLALSKIHHFTRGGGNHFQDDLCKVHCCAQRDLVHGHHVTSSWLPCSA